MNETVDARGPTPDDPANLARDRFNIHRPQAFRFSMFRGYDYIRGAASRWFTEINVDVLKYSLRIVLPRLGVSLWRDYNQIASMNYPRIGAQR